MRTRSINDLRFASQSLGKPYLKKAVALGIGPRITALESRLQPVPV